MKDQLSAATRLAPDVSPPLPALEYLRGPEDVRRLSPAQLQRLAEEMREFLIDAVTRIGGHLGAGLGVVELTIALFAELDLNDGDKLVWDVGHQCYPHKLLTGRARGFESLRRRGGMSGFPDPRESSWDTVKTGHGGTSISTAAGFALAWKHAGADPERRAVAVIGDGALQEGSAYEALHHAGSIADLPLIVVLNDNGMSISPSAGALPGLLDRQGRSGGDNFFEQLGFRYCGPFDGHDIEAVRRALRTARCEPGPVVLHLLTRKGRGYRDGEPEHTCYHAVSAAGGGAVEYPQQGGPSFTAAFADAAIAMAEEDPRLVVVTAAMLEGTGLVKFQRRFPDRCHDVGMAEQHAVALAAGLALAGRRPICAIYSTFLQRAYDQVFQEVALQRARVLFCLDRGGLVGSDGATHNGVFDVGYLRCLPNLALMAPRDIGELAQMMRLAWEWDGPVAIRFPRGSGARPEWQLPHAPLTFGRAERVAPGEDGCILAYGAMTYAALEVRRRLLAESGVRLAVVNARFAKPLDEDLIAEELQRQPVVFTLEDHALSCGFGAAVAELAHTRLSGQMDSGRLCLLGIPDRFFDHAERAEQLEEAELGVDQIKGRVVRLLGC